MKGWLILFVFFSSSLFCLNYKVTFSGLKDNKTLDDLEENSSLFQHIKKPPKSLNSLRFRINNDLPSFKKVLQNRGYFDAKIEVFLKETREKAFVEIKISPGKRYILKQYDISCQKFSSQCLKKLTPELLSLVLGDFYEAKKIGEARLKIILELAQCGYPLATIEKQDIVVNTEKKWVTVNITVNQGVLCRFGHPIITGLKSVKPEFVRKKIAWQENEIYSSKKLDQTQMSLISSQLFSSVSLVHAEDDGSHFLPIRLELDESKHRSISLGLSYATIDGIGTTLAWGHRNIRGLGEQLHLEGNFAQNNVTGKITYVKPDLFALDQNYVVQAKAERENIRVYLAFTYSLMNRLDWKFDSRNYFSLGVEVSDILVNCSINNGKYWLLDLPVYYKYSTTKDILNPTSGFIFIYQPIPSEIVSPERDFYFKEKLTTCTYFSIGSLEKLVLSFRLQLNSIVGTPLKKIPMTELFFGGADDDLRGYRYHTVSPKIKKGPHKGDLTGGRSAIYFTFEPRLRLTTSFGLVPFFDVGTLSRRTYPNPQKKWYKSAGIGLRYFTFFGPLRLDIGFPFDRRKFDPHYRIYVSIGQTF